MTRLQFHKVCASGSSVCLRSFASLVSLAPLELSVSWALTAPDRMGSRLGCQKQVQVRTLRKGTLPAPPSLTRGNLEPCLSFSPLPPPLPRAPSLAVAFPRIGLDWGFPLCCFGGLPASEQWVSGSCQLFPAAASAARLLQTCSQPVRLRQFTKVGQESRSSFPFPAAALALVAQVAGCLLLHLHPYRGP